MKPEEQEEQEEQEQKGEQDENKKKRREGDTEEGDELIQAKGAQECTSKRSPRVAAAITK